MTSERKAESNCRNALKSTGPRMPKGTAAVSQNVLRRGLLSREVLLPGEGEAVLRELAEHLYNPSGSSKTSPSTGLSPPCGGSGVSAA